MFMTGLRSCRAPARQGLRLVAVLLAATPAHAASPEAWAAHRQEVASACVAASTLRGARPAGQPVDFDDSVGMTALLVAGRHAAPHMKGRRARELCLFDKRSRTAAMAPAEALLDKPAK